MTRKKKFPRHKARSVKRRPKFEPSSRQKQSAGPLDWPIPSAEQRTRIMKRLTNRGEKRTLAECWELGRLYVYEGCIEEDERRLDDGVDLLMQAASAEPPHADAVLDLAWVLLLRGLSSMALNHAERATRLMPKRRDAWAFYGRACADRGRIDEAQRALETACTLADSVDDDRKFLEQLKTGTLSRDQTNVMSFFATDMTARHIALVQNEEALKYRLFILRQLLDNDPKNELLLYANAQIRYELKQFDQAQELAERLTRLHKAHVDGLTLLAVIHAKANQVGTAIDLYRQAVSVDTGHVLANANLAKHLIDLGRIEEARTHLDRALATDPENALALHLYGNSIALWEKDYKREATFHRRALKADSSRPAFHLSYCLCLMQQGDFDSLERAWSKGKRLIATIENEPLVKVIPILLDPPFNPSLFNTILSLKKRFGGAAVRRAIERMLVGVPRCIPKEEFPGAYCDVGLLAGQCGLHDLSLQAFIRTEQIVGRGTAASLNVAAALSELGQHSEAVERASEVSPDEPRALTILGNCLRGAERFDEAFECYRRAVRVDTGFLMPIENGTNIGCRLRRWKEVEELQNALQNIDGQELSCALVRCSLLASQGKPWKVVEALEEPLMAAVEGLEVGPEHLPEPLRALIKSDPTPEQLAQFLLQQRDDEALETQNDFSRTDLTVLSDDDVLKEAWFALASSLWACGHTTRAMVLIDRGRVHPLVQPDGNWDVLKAECLRLEAEPELARKIVYKMAPQPPPLITGALISLAEGDITQAVDLANRAARLEVEGARYHHPLGETRALAKAVMSFGAIEGDAVEEAEALARQGYELDQGSSFCALALIASLKAKGDVEAAIKVGQEALHAQPGDPELVRWCVEAYLDQGLAEQADNLLGGQRQFMELRSAGSVAAELGETVARELLVKHGQKAIGSNSKQTADWAWLEHLQPDARRWLEGAVLYADRLQWLRVGLAFHLCKVAEMELVHRLVLPFEAEMDGKDFDFDSRIRDLATYLHQGGRPPSLGAISMALRLGAERTQYRDGELMREWRSFIRSRSWPGSRMLVSLSFLDRLEQLRRARNRVAHLGDLTEADFTELYSFLIDNEGPGDFFKALGVVHTSS